MAPEKKSRLAMLTIGQTPRPDVISDLVDAMNFPVEITELGVLDGLQAHQIVAPAAGDDTFGLSTRMSDGKEVICSEPWIMQRLTAMLEDIDADKFDAILMLCSGQMNGLGDRLPLVLAGDAVDGPIEDWLAAGQDIAIVVPNKSQISELTCRYSGRGSVIFAVASPYRNTDFVEAGKSVKGVSHIVMHCMGYDTAMCRQLSSGAGIKAMTARQMFADYLADKLISSTDYLPN